VQLNVACEYRGAVITRSGPTSKICGGSANISVSRNKVMQLTE
jgi:hypothetical protein